jgi:two-component system sensor histidine kinase YesM
LQPFGEWFRDRRIRIKILLVYLPLLLLPFLVPGYVGNAVYSNVVVERTGGEGHDGRRGSQGLEACATLGG